MVSLLMGSLCVAGGVERGGSGGVLVSPSFPAEEFPVGQRVPALHQQGEPADGRAVLAGCCDEEWV